MILKNPTETQDAGSSPDGRGPAVEMLNCLRVTDVYQIPALLSPAEIVFIGDIPGKYTWSESVLKKLGKAGYKKIDEI